MTVKIIVLSIVLACVAIMIGMINQVFKKKG